MGHQSRRPWTLLVKNAQPSSMSSFTFSLFLYSQIFLARCKENEVNDDPMVNYCGIGKHFTRTVDAFTQFEAIVNAGPRDEDDEDDLYLDEYVYLYLLFFIRLNLSSQ
jgi:hypothetical protein